MRKKVNVDVWKGISCRRRAIAFLVLGPITSVFWCGHGSCTPRCEVKRKGQRASNSSDKELFFAQERRADVAKTEEAVRYAAKARNNKSLVHRVPWHYVGSLSATCIVCPFFFHA